MFSFQKAFSLFCLSLERVVCFDATLSRDFTLETTKEVKEVKESSARSTTKTCLGKQHL